MIGHGLGVRRNVEDLSLAHPGEMAGGDVANRIGTGLSRRETDFRQTTHDGRDVLQFDEMQLDVLPRGHVPDAGRIALRQFGNAPQLVCRDAAERNLDTHHLDTGLTLAIDAVLQTERLEEIVHDFSGQHSHGFFLEGFDFFENGGGNGFRANHDAAACG